MYLKNWKTLYYFVFNFNSMFQISFCISYCTYTYRLLFSLFNQKGFMSLRIHSIKIFTNSSTSLTQESQRNQIKMNRESLKPRTIYWNSLSCRSTLFNSCSIIRISQKIEMRIVSRIMSLIWIVILVLMMMIAYRLFACQKKLELIVFICIEGEPRQIRVIHNQMRTLRNHFKPANTQYHF